MEAQISWLDDPEVFKVNQLEAHSDHMFYAAHEEILRGESSLKQSLNGKWQFAYAKMHKKDL